MLNIAETVRKQVLWWRGLVMLDKAGIVHNDIKPDNLIWTEAQLSSQAASGQTCRVSPRPTTAPDLGLLDTSLS